MLQKQAGHNPMGHVILVPGVSPVRSRRGAHYDYILTRGAYPLEIREFLGKSAYSCQRTADLTAKRSVDPSPVLYGHLGSTLLFAVGSAVRWQL